jgi:hypothetical protein
MSIALPGNDFRLGACEAPPAIVTSYLGERMTEYLEALMAGTEYLEAFMAGTDAKYAPKKKMIDLGCREIVTLPLPSPTEVAVLSSAPLDHLRTLPWGKIDTRVREDELIVIGSRSSSSMSDQSTELRRSKSAG